jgi:hypothetical protein
MSKTNAVVVTLLLGLCLWTAGCKTTEIVGPSGETEAVYSWGSLKATEGRAIAVVNTAALKAMEDLNLAVTMKTADSLTGMIIAHDSQDQKITVHLTAVTENSTKICIKAGAFGNEAKSRLIYKQIQTNLGMQK